MKKKYVIITASTKGIGRALTHSFASNGYPLIINSRTPSDLEQLTNQIKNKYKVDCIAIQADLSDRDQIHSFIDTILSLNIPIQILINNAGIFIPGNIAEEPEGQLETMISTNLLSAYHVTRGLLPIMLKENTAHIFNMCSVASLKAYKQGGSYSISKYALLGFSDNLRLELQDTKVKVTAIMPGATYTNSWKESGVNPLRLIPAEDIANAVFSSSQMSKRAVVEHLVIRPQQGDL